MKLEQTRLPWTGAPVNSINNLSQYLAAHLPQDAGQYLPRFITLFVDPEIEERELDTFVSEMICALRHELQRRARRKEILVGLSLFTGAEIEAFLTERTGVQPWAIYYSRFGGLGIPDSDGLEGSSHGVVPCSSMQNHGVAWSHDNAGRIHVWLATSRKEGHGWDWDSDIGHESAHAAFAQVPLFTQLLSKAIDESPLAEIDSVRELTTAHLARITYFYAELAVVAIRGEQRQTQTNLPVAEQDEMRALLNLSDQMAPHCGFREALIAFERANGVLDMNDGMEIYKIAVPVMRAIPSLASFATAATPPDLTTFCNALRSGNVSKVLGPPRQLLRPTVH